MLDLSTDPEHLKLNLGAGDAALEGYANLDRKHGDEVYPLGIEGRAEEIRASHILEHFSHREIPAVLADWVKALRPGGVLKLAVPDLEWIARAVLAGTDAPIQGYLMGGQVDADDFHKCAFDEEYLAESMRQAGLIDIERWPPDAKDCSALPVSLNLMGRKPAVLASAPPLKIVAVLSTPRLGFDDNFDCRFKAIAPLGIEARKYKGAFWEQCISRAMQTAVEEDGADAVLAIDYDTAFLREDVERLSLLMREHPEADAIAPIQSARWRAEPLLTMDLPAGVKAHDRIPPGVFSQPLTRIKTAHFGLTLIRAESLRKLPKPWFWGQPDEQGEWGEGRTDPDPYFWRKFEAAGLKVFSANRVTVGHFELMVLWPGEDFRVVTQFASDFAENGKPKGIWK